MRLYKMELYKLCHRKSFLAGFLFVLLIGLLFFYQELQHSYCVVNGTTYTGLRAIQMNRQITEEFKGVLTDEKIERIIENTAFRRERRTATAGRKTISSIISSWSMLLTAIITARMITGPPQKPSRFVRPNWAAITKQPAWRFAWSTTAGGVSFRTHLAY